MLWLLSAGNLRVPTKKRTHNMVTMRDIAKAAGVSRMTVSRAMKSDGLVSPATRERVMQVVNEMNYVPDQVAGSLTTRRSGFVAMLVPSLNNLHFAETVQSLTESLEEIGQQILLGCTDYSVEREEQLVENMLKRRPEAIVMSYDGHSDRTIRLLGDVQVPVIELWERPDDPIGHTVGFSNRKAAFAMTESLIAEGYQTIGFLGEAKDDWTRGAARRQGFIDAMNAAGLSPHRLLQIGKPPLSIEDGARAAPEFMRRYPDTDCLFCVSDAPAFGALSALVTSGLQVPQDIGVAGFGNFEISRFSNPTLSTVVVDPRRVGQEAGRLIDRLLSADNHAELESIHIPVNADVSLRGSSRGGALQ